MVDRILAIAELDERPDAADGTRTRAAAGDRDETWILEQWQAGRLLLAQVAVIASVRDDDRGPVEARLVLDGVWLEHDAPPAVEDQVADIAPSALEAVAAELRERGVAVQGEELQRCYLHVELGERLRRALG